MFKRGDKIHYYGADSIFEGWFIELINKLPLDYDGIGDCYTDADRAIVQQKDTGILLIKQVPLKSNKGWPSEKG